LLQVAVVLPDIPTIMTTLIAVILTDMGMRP